MLGSGHCSAAGCPILHHCSMDILCSQVHQPLTTGISELGNLPWTRLTRPSGLGIMTTVMWKRSMKGKEKQTQAKNKKICQFLSWLFYRIVCQGASPRAAPRQEAVKAAHKTAFQGLIKVMVMVVMMMMVMMVMVVMMMVVVMMVVVVIKWSFLALAPLSICGRWGYCRIVRSN